MRTQIPAFPYLVMPCLPSVTQVGSTDESVVREAAHFSHLETGHISQWSLLKTHRLLCSWQGMPQGAALVRRLQVHLQDVVLPVAG